MHVIDLEYCTTSATVKAGAHQLSCLLYVLQASSGRGITHASSAPTAAKGMMIALHLVASRTKSGDSRHSSWYSSPRLLTTSLQRRAVQAAPSEPLLSAGSTPLAQLIACQEQASIPSYAVPSRQTGPEMHFIQHDISLAHLAPPGKSSTFSLLRSSRNAAMGLALTAPNCSNRGPSGPFQWPALRIS